MPRKYVLWLIGLGSAIIVLLIALIVILITDDGEPTAAPTTATTTTVVATTAGSTTAATAPPTTATTMPPTTMPSTTAPATTVTTTPPTTAAPPSCVDAGPIPAAATDGTSVSGDFDGDGAPDGFTAYRLGSSWFLWANLSADGGYRLVTEIDLPWSFAYWDGTTPGNLAVVDANSLGDPREVVTVRLYAGLGQSFALFAIEDCRIVPFVMPAGTIPDLYQAMGANHSDFPVCDAGAGLVRQVVVSCGGQVATCPSLDLSAEDYEVARDPATLTPLAPLVGTIDQTEYQGLVANSCIG